MAEALLSELHSGGSSELLPSNTHVFASTVQYNRVFIALAGCTGLPTFTLLVAAIAAHHAAPGTRAALAIVAVVLGYVCQMHGCGLQLARGRARA
ncbi:hypothetical protein EON66_09000 [archaeon]|nr:MAG: hypothetical protein EON66_09000 [archaeon]